MPNRGHGRQPNHPEEPEGISGVQREAEYPENGPDWDPESLQSMADIIKAVDDAPQPESSFEASVSRPGVVGDTQQPDSVDVAITLAEGMTPEDIAKGLGRSLPLAVRLVRLYDNRRMRSYLDTVLDRIGYERDSELRQRVMESLAVRPEERR